MQSACSWGLQDTGSVQSQRYFRNKTPQYKMKSLKFEKKPKMLFLFFIMLIFTSGAKAMVGKTFGPLLLLLLLSRFSRVQLCATP